MKLIKYTHRTVTQGEWGVSCTTGTHIQGAILNIYRSRFNGRELPYDKWMRGFGNGRTFATLEAADQWAFDHGYTQLFFYPELHAKKQAFAKLHPEWYRRAA